MTEAGTQAEPEKVEDSFKEKNVSPAAAAKETAMSTKQLSSVVQGTAENLLGKLEDAVTAGGGGGTATTDDDNEDDEVLQDSEPGPLSQHPKEVEEVLNVISQSIYREGQGKLVRD